MERGLDGRPPSPLAPPTLPCQLLSLSLWQWMVVLSVRHTTATHPIHTTKPKQYMFENPRT